MNALASVKAGVEIRETKGTVTLRKTACHDPYISMLLRARDGVPLGGTRVETGRWRGEKFAWVTMAIVPYAIVHIIR
jgi:hypothetical protein